MTRLLLTVAMLLALSHSRHVTAPVGAQQPATPAPGASLPGTRLTIEQLREQFDRLGAGRRLRPKTWPNGSRSAAVLTFEVDNATPQLASGVLTLWALSEGEYGGRDGLGRVLRLLDKHGVPATFFVPAVSDILQPTIIPSILAGKRHEIAAHGWIHEDLALLSSEEEERSLLEKSIEYLTKTAGKRPTGFRSPNASFSQFSIKLLKQAGFTYDSTLMSSDDAFELKLNGQPTGLVELPVHTILQDTPYFPRNGSLPSPEHVYTIYKDEFDLAYDEGRLFIIALHPHVIGHRSRVAMLDQLLTYMKSKPGVWFTTAELLAEYVRKNAEPTQ